ncbi:MAG: hypothetical protein Fur0018_11510 [Anaerolineales bacterium]
MVTDLARSDPEGQAASSIATPTQAAVMLSGGQAFSGGVVVLSLQQGNSAHLFAYQPPQLPLTRLTDGHWMDIHPAISPDGEQLAFVSNRGGNWDLFMLSLATSEVTRLTDTPAYEGHPSWSPDGLWLAYDAYVDDNLEIMVYPLDGSQPPIRLTYDAHADYAPAWSPRGRQIAFVSTRSGEPEIWLADLDRIEQRFVNLSHNRTVQEDHPQWNADGSALVWSGIRDGEHGIYLWHNGVINAAKVGTGDWPAWGPGDGQIATLLRQPNDDYLSAFQWQDGSLTLPPLPLPGTLRGLTWKQITLPNPLPQPYQWALALTPTPYWQVQITPAENLPPGRYVLAHLEGVQAPYAYLSDAVDEAFAALRAQTSQAIGWDFLGMLENAYLPLTAPAMPDLAENWLYTGRGFAVSSAPMNAGWMVAVKETYGTLTYWRLYLRPLRQDGTQGLPLTQSPWDFSARYTGDPQGYEQGGLLISDPPPGYWVDFTALAQAYGWQRQPALPNWRTYFPGTRLGEFAAPEGLDWESALLQLYPPEMLITPTPVASSTPTFTPTVTPSPTITPTRTPAPTRTPWPTRTPIPSKTPSPTVTPTLTPTPTPTPLWGTGR